MSQPYFSSLSPPSIQRPPLTVFPLLLKLTQLKFLHISQTLLVSFDLPPTLIIRRVRERRSTQPMPKSRIISPIRVMCNCHSEQRADGHVVDVVSVVFAAGDGDESGANQGRESQQDASEVCAGTIHVALASDKERKVSQTAKSKAAMAAGKAAPAIVQGVMIRLGVSRSCAIMLLRMRSTKPLPEGGGWNQS